MSKASKSGWTPRKLNELGIVGRGKSKHRPRNDSTLYNGPYPFIQTANIMASELYITKYSQTFSEKGLAQSNWGTAKEVQSTKLAFKRGEILFGKIRPYFHKVGVAPVDGVCSSDTIVIMPQVGRYFGTVLCCVSSEDFVKFATQTSQGTKMPRASWSVLVKYLVVLPPQPILYQFDEFIKDIVLQIQRMIFRNRNLRQTRDLLLPKLISGEVDVEKLDIQGSHIEGGTNASSGMSISAIS